jgi:hypothetical protein
MDHNANEHFQIWFISFILVTMKPILRWKMYVNHIPNVHFEQEFSSNTVQTKKSISRDTDMDR